MNIKENQKYIIYRAFDAAAQKIINVSTVLNAI